MSNIAKVKIGDKFNRLTVVEDLGRCVKDGTKTKMHYVKCKCECGNEKVVPLTHLNTGRIKSCGCLNKELASKRSKKYNEYEVFQDTVFVKFSNCNEYFICDLDDWNKLKDHCWRKNHDGYATTDHKHKPLLFHRVVTNCPSDMEVDHVFRVCPYICDNRKKNLNIVTHKENMENLDLSCRNKSGYTNVYYDKERRKWTSQIRVDRKPKFLGRFNTIDEAINARKEAEKKYYLYKASLVGDLHE